MDQRKLIELEGLISSEYGNTVGMVVQKGERTVYEKYYHGYTADKAVHVYSVTKSVFSALIGIAIDKGFIKSVEEKVLDFFPEYPLQDENDAIRHITLKHLLTMTAPYRCEEEPYADFFASDNWMDFALSLLGGSEPTDTFKYSPIVGSHILSGILAKATGKPVLDFATEVLFAPLGINVPCNVVLRTEAEHIAFGNGENTSGWVVDPQGINPASWGLCLTPGDMAKIGQLYLNGGSWNGTQIISTAWIAESTKEHSRWQALNLAYGYLWWVLDEKAGIYAAMGDGGNVLYVNTQKQLVVAITALFMPDARDRIELIMTHIEPMFAD